MPANEIHISSFVVYCKPEALQSVKHKVESFETTEIYAESEDGKLVVVMETRNQGFITSTIDTINDMPEVISTALVYHQIETDIDTLDDDIHATVASAETIASAEDAATDVTAAPKTPQEDPL